MLLLPSYFYNILLSLHQPINDIIYKLPLISSKHNFSATNIMIKALSQEVAQDLCAQQVITSICDCIKQLVDNSIDAQSTKIAVSLDEYGKERIQVIDNGVGIQSFQFLARKGSTSKNKGNYQEVRTLGFRGQALHSLAKVSRKMTITSCHKSKTTQYNVKQNKCNQITSGRDDGTIVLIESLFEYLPVRRYELLNKYKEFLKKIDQMMRQYCVIYPSISFVLRNVREGKTDIILETASHQGASWQKNWQERIKQVLGMKVSQNLMYMKTNYVEGWVLKNIESGSSKQNTYIRRTLHYTYLNSRPIDSIPKIISVLDDFYKKYNRSTKYIDVINILLPWDTYDVNLTPNKREIFIKEHLLTKIVNQIGQFISKNIVEVVPVLEHYEENQKNKMIDRMSNFMKSGQNKRQPVQQTQHNQQLQFKKIEDQDHEKQLKKFNQTKSEVPIDPPNMKQKQKRLMTQNQMSKEIKERTNIKLKQKSQEKLIQSLNERMSIGNKKNNLSYKDLGIATKLKKDKTDQVIKQEVQQEYKSNQNQILMEEKPIRSKENFNEVLKQKVAQNNKKKTENAQNNCEVKMENSKDQDDLVPQKFSCTLKQESFKQFYIIGQFNHGFITCLFEDKYYLVDQHAASQKYHFEKLLKAARSRAQVEELIQLSAVQIESIEQQKQKLEENGYRFQIMEDNTVLLTQVPVFLGKSYGKQYFLDIALSNKGLNELPDYYNAAATKACRTAVMVGDVLQLNQMKSIVSELSDLQSPWNCPHGRPTLIYLGTRPNFEKIVENRQNSYNLGIE